ncbi:hypothetical protein GCM10020256_63720 [Streptomyces thermocoprophilus]
MRWSDASNRSGSANDTWGRLPGPSAAVQDRAGSGAVGCGRGLQGAAGAGAEGASRCAGAEEAAPVRAVAW